MCILFDPPVARVLAVLRAVYASSSQLTPIMKRDVYYSNALVLSNQAKADRILNQFTSQLSISLPECFVRPAPRGMLFGPIEWLEAGELVSAALEVQMIPASPPFRCDRLSAIVIVEKESIFAEFVDSRLFSGLHCLFITAKGYPNFQTLNFLHIVSKQVIAPIFVLYARISLDSLPSIHSTANLRSFTGRMRILSASMSTPAFVEDPP